MKFTNGYWCLKDGMEPHFAASAIEAEQRGNELVVYAPEKQIKYRWDTLNMPLLTVRYSSPMSNVIKVRISHFEGGVDKGPHFPLESDLKFKPSIRITEKNSVLESGELSVLIDNDAGWGNRFCGGGKTLTKNQYKSTAYMVDRDKGPFIKEELSLAVGELVYGLGERFGPLVKNGQTVDIWNADGGTASEKK